jgi:hypothetical protein
MQVISGKWTEIFSGSLFDFYTFEIFILQHTRETRE